MLPLIYIGSVSIPSYGLCMATGIVTACTIAFLRVKHRGGNFDALLMIAAVAMAFGLTGAKVSYYIFSYGIDRLFLEVFSGDFSAFSSTGLVFYGGLIGGIIGALIAINANQYDLDLYATSIIPCIPLGHAFGRIGCLLAGCCYGLHYEGLFAIHSSYADPSETLFPIQAIESLLNVFLYLYLVIYTRKNHNGLITLAVYIVCYSVARFILEFFRGDLIRGIYLGFSTSQWISAFLVFVGAIVIALSKRGKLHASASASN